MIFNNNKNRIDKGIVSFQFDNTNIYKNQTPTSIE